MTHSGFTLASLSPRLLAEPSHPQPTTTLLLVAAVLCVLIGLRVMIRALEPVGFIVKIVMGVALMVLLVALALIFLITAMLVSQ